MTRPDPGFLRPALFVLLTALAWHVNREQGKLAEPPRFNKVVDGLYSLTQWWRVLPLLPAVPVRVFLVHHGHNWALVDAGVAGNSRQAHPQQLLEALGEAIPAGDRLVAVIMTHAHPDHVGALPQLLAAYPDVKVVAHEEEAPYLLNSGDKDYVPPTGVAAHFLQWTGFTASQPVKVPAERADLLTEPLSDFTSYGLEELVYVVTIGHSPGHISLLHAPSRTLLAGDALSFLRPSLRLTLGSSNSSSGSGDGAVAGALGSQVTRTLKLWPFPASLVLSAKPHTICVLPSCDKKKAVTSFCMLADGLQWDRLLASHGWAQPGSSRGDLSQEELQALAAQRPECEELSSQVAEGGAAGGEEYAVEEDEEEDEYE